jgi:hypothetical protein
VRIREMMRAAALTAALGLAMSAEAEPQPLKDLATLAPKAIAWAQALSATALKSGTPLTPLQRDIAVKSGVRDASRIRIVVTDRVPLPDEATLRAAATKVGLSEEWAAGMTLGYAVIVRRGYENDVRLLSHEFRHVAQYEAVGGIAQFLTAHLQHLAQFGYENSPFEVDARAHEQAAAPLQAGAPRGPEVKHGRM